LGGEDARRIISESRESFYALSVLVYVYLYLRPSNPEPSWLPGERGRA
jgi:hypothetical protein